MKHIYRTAAEAFHRENYAEVRRILKPVLMKNPAFEEGFYLYGTACLRENALNEAETAFRRSIAIRENVDNLKGLGLVLTEKGDAQAAIAVYPRILERDPLNWWAANNLGNALASSRPAEAEELYLRAIAAKPDYAYAWKNLGALLLDQPDRLAQAEAAIRNALANNSDISGLTLLLARCLDKQDRLNEAIPLFEAALAFDHLQFAARNAGRWWQLSEIDEAVWKAEEQQTSPASPWTYINKPSLTPERHKRVARRFAVAEVEGLLTPPLAPSLADCRNVSTQVPTRLRIGYLSCDFFDHATMHLLMGVLEAHDPEQVEVLLFSHSPRREDAYTYRLGQLNGSFTELNNLTDQESAIAIAAAKLDILVDLKGFTTGARFGIVARRPAPIIVSWLGYPGTLGHERLADYIIGDPIVTPAINAPHFTERLALMPICYQPNDAKRIRPAASSREAEGLPERGIVFCSFNQMVKINPERFAIWCRLLHEVPGSVLWLLMPDREPARQALIDAAASHGVEGRVILAARVPQRQHLARLQLADIALDTFPCNSHTTASDALWAGVPIIGQIGETFASRVSASLLMAIGQPDLVTCSDSEYLARSFELANDADRLGCVKERLRAARTSSPLFDSERFARDLEILFRAIVANERSEKPVGVVTCAL